MKKWNMIIDVAECTNCQLCALSAMDEYVGNMWPGVAAPMPRHGHQWIDIKQKERGQAPMIDIAYVPTMCNHCDNAPCLAKGGDAVKKRADGKYWNVPLEVYPNVSQFWHYNPEEYMKQPPYSRTFQGIKG